MHTAKILWQQIIKRNISYEDDPTPLIILKIDIKKEESKTTAVEYEVYNPINGEKLVMPVPSPSMNVKEINELSTAAPP